MRRDKFVDQFQHGTLPEAELRYPEFRRFGPLLKPPAALKPVWQDRLAELGQKSKAEQQMDDVIGAAGGLEKWVNTVVKGQAAAETLQRLVHMMGKEEAQTDLDVEIMKAVVSKTVKGPAISKNRTVEYQIAGSDEKVAWT